MSAHFKSQTATFKVQKCTFVTEQKPGPELTSSPTVAARPAKPYRRIEFVNGSSSVTLPSDGANTTTKTASEPGELGPIHSKRRRVEVKATKDTRLTVKRPVKVAEKVHEDAWRLILSFCEPKFLLRMRYMSPLFYHILKESKIWRDSRENNLNDKIPDCPSFLTEQQYVDLLVGMGCQNHLCLKRETKKPYWVFGCRLCEDCLRQKTSSEQHPAEPSPQSMFQPLDNHDDHVQQFGSSLIDLIPTALMDGGKYSRPRPVSTGTGQWFSQARSPQPLMYMKGAYHQIVEEFRRIRQEQWTPERVREWTRQRYERAIARSRFAEQFPTFHGYGRLRLEQTSWRENVRDQRDDFFASKAAALPQPITHEELQVMSAYLAALQSPNPPSERAWNMLLPKILPFQDEARRIARYRETQLRFNFYMATSDWPEEAKLYKKLHEHRCINRRETGEVQPEQAFVLGLGRGEFARLGGTVPDEDLILLCLRTVFDRYQEIVEKPIGLNFDGVTGPYRLSLDDARMIVDEVIRPEFERSTLQYLRVFESFKCSGCTRYQSNRKWGFRGAFEHILYKHAIVVGDDLHYSRYAKTFVRPGWPPHAALDGLSSANSSFPWYLAAWTRTLPLLPAHVEITATTKWHPDATAPYRLRSVGQSGSAFAGRTALRATTHPAVDFAEALQYAAGVMAPTRLDTSAVLKVALAYSMRLHHDLIHLRTFVSCCRTIERKFPRLKMTFKCGICSTRSDLLKRAKFARTPMEVESLAEHWEEKHRLDDVDWPVGMLQLPSDEELMDIMLEHDAALQEAQSKSRERETVGIQKTNRKVPDPKAKALMEKEMAVDNFARLFPPL